MSETQPYGTLWRAGVSMGSRKGPRVDRPETAEAKRVKVEYLSGTQPRDPPKGDGESQRLFVAKGTPPTSRQRSLVLGVLGDTPSDK